MRVFVDTSAILALLSSRDRLHAEAKRTYRDLVRSQAVFLTTDWVLAEAVTLARRRAGYAAARTVGDALLGAGFELLWVDRSLVDDAWRWFEKFRDQELSLCDCLSFATMRSRALKVAYAYDDDFRIAGFDVAGRS